MSKFPVNSKVAFVSYAYFTLLYFCIGHYALCHHNFNNSVIIQQANEFARNMLYVHKHYMPKCSLKTFTDVKISTFLKKNGEG